MGPNPNERGLSRKHIIECCHASLRRLQSDHLDLLQAHRYDAEAPLDETLRAFDDLVRQGKVHYIGVSEWSAGQIADALAIAAEMGFDRIISNQPQYSLLWRVIEAEVVPLCENEGIGQIVFSPLAQGVLTGKYRPGAPPPEGSRATDPSGATFIRRLLRDEVLEAVQAFVGLARVGRLLAGRGRPGLGADQRERRFGDHRGDPARASRREREGAGRGARRRPPPSHRRGPRAGGRTRPRPSPSARRAGPEPAGRRMAADPLTRIRTVCSGLPEATERLSHGAPTFGIGSGRSFVMYWDDHHGDGRLALWCAAPAGAQEALVAADPDRFFRPPYVGHRGWVGMRIDGRPTGPRWPRSCSRPTGRWLRPA